MPDTPVSAPVTGEYTDTAKPLAPQLAHARFMTAPAGDPAAGSPPAGTGGTGDGSGGTGTGAAGAGTGTGGTGAGTGSGQQGDPAGQQQAGQQQPGQEQQQTAQWPEWDGNVESLPEPIQRMVTNLRNENGRNRHNAKDEAADTARKDLLSTLQKALGGEESQTPTVESLTKDVQTQQTAAQEAETKATTAEADATTARRETSVLRAAARLGNVDGDSLLDSREFENSLKDLDPADTQAVEKHVKEYADKYPRFITQAVGTSSVDPAAGSGNARPRPVLSIADAAAEDLARGPQR